MSDTAAPEFLGYTVVDFETTGLSNIDRVIEAAFVNVSPEGALQDEWSTLVNPLRNAGRTDIHGIATRDLQDAPQFSELVPKILDTTRGRVLVAHNAPFDSRFLFHEMRRTFIDMKEKPSALCTMKWSKKALGTGKLDECCAAVGIRLDDAHEALADTRATAELLIHLLGTGIPDFAQTQIDASLGFVWPAATMKSNVVLKNRSTQERVIEGWLDRVGTVSRRDADGGAYLEALELALLDRQLSAHDEDTLVSVATESGLSRTNLDDLHLIFLRSTCARALSEGRVDDDKWRDLVAVAVSLGLPGELVEPALVEAAHRPSPTLATFTLNRGDRVAFTGGSPMARKALEAAADRAGLTYGGLVKATKVLVAAEVDSMSNAAQKARKQGTPILESAAFDRLIADSGLTATEQAA
jgi:DNA polymerase-3 subunit epsilon